MTALMLPCFMVMLALIVDIGLWLIDSARLQIAADGAAMVTATMMLTSPYQSQAVATQAANAIQVAAVGAQLGANQLRGPITPTVTIDGPNYTTATVTLTMPVTSFFGSAISAVAPTLRATATATIAPRSCVLALAPSGTGITVDTNGTLKATNCPVFSNANDPALPSILLNSGTLSGFTVGAAGTIVQSGTGNSMTPTTTSAGRPSQPDYLAGNTPPSDPGCTVTNYQVQSGGTTTLTPGTEYCGASYVIGGTVNVPAGIYYVKNGYLSFQGVSLNFSSGVTFVLEPAAQLYFAGGTTTANPLVAPSTGPTAGYAVWQPCGRNPNSASTGVAVVGNSTLSVSGAIYTPCDPVVVGMVGGGAIQTGAAKLAAAPGGSLTVVANTIRVSASGSSLTATSTTAALATPVLVN